MIAVLIPTRNRPEGITRVVESARATAKDFRILFYVDDDDKESVHEILKHPTSIVRYAVGPRIVLSNTWNVLANAALTMYPEIDIVMQGNDDIVFETPGWDSQVIAAFAASPDKILMVHGSDKSSHQPSSIGKFGPHPFVHRKWIETLGYFTPPYFSSDFGDTWVNEVANAIGRRQYIPVVIEHMHYLFGKAKMDSTTEDRLSRHSADQVECLYADLVALRKIDIEKLRKAMQ